VNCIDRKNELMRREFKDKELNLMFFFKLTSFTKDTQHNFEWLIDDRASNEFSPWEVWFSIYALRPKKSEEEISFGVRSQRFSNQQVMMTDQLHYNDLKSHIYVDMIIVKTMLI
jgi:hypothetical protein